MDKLSVKEYEDPFKGYAKYGRVALILHGL